MDKDIVKSNALVEACYRPASLNQMRLLLAAMLDIKAGEELDHKREFTITAGGFSALTDTTLRTNYKALAQAADDLMNMIITVNVRPNGDPRRVHKRKINVVSACDYVENEGCVKLEFTPAIIPYISNLKTQFTKYNAKNIMHMKSSYGIRLYELCLQWLATGNAREFTVQDFKKLFGLEKKYPRVGTLKDKVIKPALNDINKYSDLSVEFGQVKAGKVITHFQFVISKKENANQQQLFAPGGASVKLSKKHIEQHAYPGESWDDAKTRLSTGVS